MMDPILRVLDSVGLGWDKRTQHFPVDAETPGAHALTVSQRCENTGCQANYKINVNSILFREKSGSKFSSGLENNPRLSIGFEKL